MAPIDMAETVKTLAKRDNMGFAIPPGAIIVLVMLGAAFAVCCGFALARFTVEDKDESWTNRSASQDDYMREVRARNIDNLMGKRSRRYQKAPPPEPSPPGYEVLQRDEDRD